jgi:hypothetical protein
MIEDDDEDYVSPYPEGALTCLTDLQLKAERMKQVHLADKAQDEDDDAAEDLATKKLVAVLFEIDRRGLRIS